ncbi:hypothetical protein Pelo_17155 [Pelomyxa schiedti]|nr:hypothetical protein Pelo_17155 [Pelomyxa schiedti]
MGSSLSQVEQQKIEESLENLTRNLEGATKHKEELASHLHKLSDLKGALARKLNESDAACKKILGKNLTVQNSEAEIQECSRNITSLTKMWGMKGLMAEKNAITVTDDTPGAFDRASQTTRWSSMTTAAGMTLPGVCSSHEEVPSLSLFHQGQNSFVISSCEVILELKHRRSHRGGQRHNCESVVVQRGTTASGNVLAHGPSPTIDFLHLISVHRDRVQTTHQPYMLLNIYDFVRFNAGNIFKRLNTPDSVTILRAFARLSVLETSASMPEIFTPKHDRAFMNACQIKMHASKFCCNARNISKVPG